MFDLSRLIVYISIHLNHEFCVRATEICNIRPERMLSPKLRTQSIPAQALPKDVLRRSRCLAHVSRQAPVLGRNVRPAVAGLVRDFGFRFAHDLTIPPI